MAAHFDLWPQTPWLKAEKLRTRTLPRPPARTRGNRQVWIKRTFQMNTQLASVKRRGAGRTEAETGQKGTHRKRGRGLPVCVRAHSCDSVTTAKLLELRDFSCQSLSPLFYCDTMQVFPSVCVCVCFTWYLSQWPLNSRSNFSLTSLFLCLFHFLLTLIWLPQRAAQRSAHSAYWHPDHIQ